MKILLGFFIIWLVLDRSAALLGSYRGEFGIVVCCLVLGVTVTVEGLFFGLKPAAALSTIGLRRANAGSMLATLGLCVLLLAFFPLYAIFTGVPLRIRADWYWLVPEGTLGGMAMAWIVLAALAPWTMLAVRPRAPA